MYFGSVRFFKHVIVAVVLIIIVGLAAGCFILGTQLVDANKQKDDLTAEIGELKKSGHQSRYTDDELFALYKENLEDKEGFLRLAYEYDTGLYRSAAGMGAVQASQDTYITAAPISTTSGTMSGTVNVIDIPEKDRPEYESLYPELYAELPDEIIYDEDIDHVYLTFDDGPSKYTKDILNYLSWYNIKATFFVVPDGSDESNARLKAIADAGHTIGIHTATHEYNKIYASVEAFLEDFKTAYDRVYQATGIKCNLYRFPGGSVNDYNTEIRDDLIAEMNRRGFIYFDWNVDSNDAMGATWTEMYNNVLTQTRDVQRAVVLMHDYNGGYNTILVLEDIIKALISDKRGYTITQLTETVKPIQF